MYKSKIILSSLTVLGLTGSAVLGSNYISSVNADVDVVKDNIKQQVETIASQVDKLKPKEESKIKSNVYAEELKPEVVHEQLINNVVSESEDLKNEDVIKENIEETNVDNVESTTDTEISHENVKLEDVNTSNQVNDVSNNVTPISEDNNVIYSDSDVVNDSKVEDSENVVLSVNDVTANVSSDFENNNDNISSNDNVETDVVEEKHENIKSIEEDLKPVETPASDVVDVKEELKTESIVEQPKNESKIEETKVETPVVETLASKPVLANPINDKTNTYPIGQCTWGVKSLADWVGNYWGNANQWGDSARKAGYTTGDVPIVGSVVVFPNVMYEGVNYGHVAYVTHVYDDGSIEVMEANYSGNQNIGNYRGKFNPNDSRHGGGVYYIYPNA